MRIKYLTNTDRTYPSFWCHVAESDASLTT